MVQAPLLLLVLLVLPTTHLGLWVLAASMQQQGVQQQQQGLVAVQIPRLRLMYAASVVVDKVT
jgi:hypothetical protein